MTQPNYRPAWVIDQSLDFEPFDCCGQENLYPFKCSACARPLVLCHECEVLYGDLNDLTKAWRLDDSGRDCPHCAAEFAAGFIQSPQHRITFEEWHEAGLDHLLVDRPIVGYLEALIAMSTPLADYLRRGMRSTARRENVRCRYLGEAIAHHFPCSAVLRDTGFHIAKTSTLAKAMQWHDQLSDPIEQAYALQGIVDAIFS